IGRFGDVLRLLEVGRDDRHELRALEERRGLAGYRKRRNAGVRIEERRTNAFLMPSRAEIELKRHRVDTGLRVGHFRDDRRPSARELRREHLDGWRLDV